MRRPIDKLVLVVEAALEKYTNDLFDHDDAHEAYCMCRDRDCVFARGIAGELSAYEKAEAKAAKQAAKRSGSAPAGGPRRRASTAAPAAPVAPAAAAPAAPGAARAARPAPPPRRRPRAPR